jgi:hypothetical protein
MLRQPITLLETSKSSLFPSRSQKFVPAMRRRSLFCTGSALSRCTMMVVHNYKKKKERKRETEKEKFNFMHLFILVSYKNFFFVGNHDIFTILS